MTDRVTVGNLRVAQVLYDFINNEALPGTDVDLDSFWAGVDKVVADLAPQNQDLLARRDELQAQIDRWHRQHVIEPIDPEAYRQFLTEIGYLLPEPDDFTITTAGVDDEITTTAGPQLVVPVLNARFALNAANARWGSLYDALYGTDVIAETDGAEKTTSYNKVRGDKVIAYARGFLDQAVPLASGSYDRRPRLQDRGRPGVDHTRRRPVHRARDTRAVRRLHGKPRRPHIRPAGQSRPAHRDPDRPGIAGRFHGRRRDQGRHPGVGRHHDHGFRGLGHRCRRRRQGARLPQLARSQQGRPDRGSHQGRAHVHPGAQRRPHLHRPRR